MRRDPCAHKRGFVLLTLTVSIIVIMGFLGLVLDLGRAYVAKNEAQAFTDAAALAAARELDSSLAGITAARGAVSATENLWYFGTRASILQSSNSARTK